MIVWQLFFLRRAHESAAMVTVRRGAAEPPRTSERSFHLLGLAGLRLVKTLRPTGCQELLADLLIPADPGNELLIANLPIAVLVRAVQGLIDCLLAECLTGTFADGLEKTGQLAPRDHAVPIQIRSLKGSS